MIAEAGIMIALAKVLSMITLFRLPQGGSITAGSMVPLILFSYRWGVGPGVAVGVIYGLIDSISGYIVHPAQFFLDYVLAYGVIGLSGKLLGNDSKSIRGYIVSIIFAFLLRFFSHFMSGVIFFGEYAREGQSAFMYSLIYNGSFLGVELIITLIIVALLWKPLFVKFKDKK